MRSYENPGPGNISFELYPDGTVMQGYLKKTSNIGGVNYCTAIGYWPGGKVRMGRIEKTARINGIDCSSFIYFYPSGKLMSCRPAAPVKVKGILFPKGQYIDFDEKGNPAAGYSAGKQKVKGITIPENRFFKIGDSGKPEIIDLEGMTGDWRVLIDGMTYECGLTLSEFACGGYSGGSRFTEWGTSCTFREFLQGDLQDFPRSYTPDDFQQILEMTELIHKKISDVEIYRFIKAEPVSSACIEKGNHLKNFSWCEGYDGEYEYSIDVYENCIVWHLQFDEQWSDPPRDAVQTRDEFLNNGPPPDFDGRRLSDEILDFVKSLK